MNINDMEKNNEIEAKPQRSFKEKLLLILTVLCALILIINTLIFADAIHTKVVTYSALGNLVQTDSVNDKRAKKQGNLGNYNITSKKNSLIDNKDGTYTLTLEFEFKNYGETGRSFSEAVNTTAYQEDKEIKPASPSLDLFSVTPDAEKQEAAPAATIPDESDVKVRNGKTAGVVIT